MRKWQAILGGIVALAILVGIVAGLYYLGGDDQSALEKLRDIVIVLFGLLMVIVTLLLAALVAAILALVIVLRQKIVPLLETLTDTARTARDTAGAVATRVTGTAEFVTEGVAAPLISAAGLVAQARAFTKVITGRDGRKRGSVTKLLED